MWTKREKNRFFDFCREIQILLDFWWHLLLNSLLAQYHNTPLLPPKSLHRQCFRFPLRHLHVPGEIANNDYAKLWREKRCIKGFVQVETLWPAVRLTRLKNVISQFQSHRGTKPRTPAWREILITPVPPMPASSFLSSHVALPIIQRKLTVNRLTGVLFRSTGVIFSLNYKNVLTAGHLVYFKPWPAAVPCDWAPSQLDLVHIFLHLKFSECLICFSLHWF